MQLLKKLLNIEYSGGIIHCPAKLRYTLLASHQAQILNGDSRIIEKM